jgi:hypothetical protein
LGLFGAATSNPFSTQASTTAAMRAAKQSTTEQSGQSTTGPSTGPTTRPTTRPTTDEDDLLTPDRDTEQRRLERIDKTLRDLGDVDPRIREDAQRRMERMDDDDFYDLFKRHSPDSVPEEDERVNNELDRRLEGAHLIIHPHHPLWLKFNPPPTTAP